MTARQLQPVSVAKPWGRTDLPATLRAGIEDPIGEVWFTDPGNGPAFLLVKYLFTSEKLSVQVHPDDDQARAIGLDSGKSECWYVLDAEPGAVLGIGLRQPIDKDALRAAALDGSIEALIDWKPVRPGSFYYIPAGTIHAIGGGIRLVEIQQNSDVTYRLYDYGRPRELHLDAAMAVSRAEPYPLPDRIVTADQPERILDGRRSLFILDNIVLEAGESRMLANGPSWVIPLKGSGMIDDRPWRGGECWLAAVGSHLNAAESSHFLIARWPETMTPAGAPPID
jgi:mannose-6-phosphate isomerase